MESYLKEALEIVKAQASVRVMTDEEITDMVSRLAAGIKDISEGANPVRSSVQDPTMDPKKAIKEKTITCL